MYLEVDSDKAAYVILPNRMVLASTNGVIDDMWYGRDGAVSLVVPKDITVRKLNNDSFTKIADFMGVYIGHGTGSFSAAGSKLSGAILPNMTSVSVGGSELFEDLHCPKAINIYADGCALPLSNIKSILDNAYTLYLANNAIEVNINLSGGTNAAINLNDSSSVHMITYGEIANTLSLAGFVTLNTI